MQRSVMFVDTFYHDLIAGAGLAAEAPAGARYQDLLADASGIGFGSGAALAEGMAALGWDSRVVVANSLSTQSAWAREHGLGRRWTAGWRYGRHVSRLPIVNALAGSLPHVQGTLLAQAKVLHPDVLYIQDLNLVPPPLARALKRHVGMLVGEHASPLPPRAFFAEYDLIVSALPPLVDRLRARGIRAEHLPLGFDSRWVEHRPMVERDIDAIFVGSFTRLQPATAPLLRAIAEQVPGLAIYGQADERVLIDAGLRKFYRGPAWGRQMYELLGRAKIAVNRHGSIAGDYAVNMRMYEATGMGAALLTEARANLADSFDLGVEVVPYTSPEDAAIQAAGLLSDPERLDAVGAAGQCRTLREHTYGRRAERIGTLLEEYFG